MSTVRYFYLRPLNDLFIDWGSKHGFQGPLTPSTKLPKVASLYVLKLRSRAALGSGFMAIGSVKWFNNAKGYGFILDDEGGEDLFVHYSAIQMDGYKTLKAGQAVQFDTVEGPKGLHAVNIRDVPDSVVRVSVELDIDDTDVNEDSSERAVGGL